MMAADQSSVRLIREEEFEAKNTREMMSYLRQLRQGKVFANEKVRTSGSKDFMITEYARLLRGNNVDDTQLGAPSASTAAASSSRDAAREVFENILIHQETRISAGTKASLNRLGAKKMYKSKKRDDMSEDLEPAFQVTEALAGILDDLRTGPDHSINYHRLRERLETSFSNDQLTTRFQALIDFCKSLGVLIDLEDGGDEDQSASKEISMELNVLSQAIERRLQEWSLTFPEPDPEDLTWPVDFYSDERSKMRKWIEDCMSEAADLEGRLNWRDTAMTNDDTEKIVESLLNRGDIPLEKARHRDTIRAVFEDERTRRAHTESRSATRSVSPKKRLAASKRTSPLKISHDDLNETSDTESALAKGKKRGREMEVEEESQSQSPLQMVKRSRQSRGRGRVRESGGRRNEVVEEEDENEGMAQMETNRKTNDEDDDDDDILF